MELKGSKTEKNLWEAFAGESMARNRYTFYASRAKKEGYEQISAFFTDTAANEKEHAEMWFKLVDPIKTTAENLKSAANGENEEHTSMYPEFARIAREEGFEDIAKKFEEVAAIEKEHEERYLELMKNIQENKVFARDEEVQWVCRNCGHVHVGKEAPEECPTCAHARGYFQLDVKNY